MMEQMSALMEELSAEKARSAALEAEARQISQGPSARRSRLQRWWAIGTFMLAMARRARATKGGSTYVIYEAKQA